MKRRDFTLCAGSTLAAATLHPACAEPAPDHTLLTTSLTPLGATRAGNADGSIPAWTGGLTAPALPAAHPVDIKLFTDEQPLHIIDAASMAGHQPLLSPGTQAMLQTTGLRLKIYPTHRTAAAPQYVYDNTAQNLGFATLDPRGGQFGFNGAYGGVPFPIIDTANPLNGGAQLIWNHLTAWNGYLRFSKFTPSFVVTSAGLTLAAASSAHSLHPYYDPNGSLITYMGYYSKSRAYYGSGTAMPADGFSQSLIWHSGNVTLWADIEWMLEPGTGRARKAPNLAYGTPNPDTDGNAGFDETSCFYGNPSQYDWRYIGKQEMYVPYNCNAMHFSTAQDLLQPQAPNPDLVRWEKHRVWIVEASLRPGQINPLARRRLYIDEDTWQALLGEAYDASGTMIKCHALYNRCIPSMPGTVTQGWAAHDLRSGNYVYSGSVNYAHFTAAEYIMTKMPPHAVFDPQEQAAMACF